MPRPPRLSAALALSALALRAARAQTLAVPAPLPNGWTSKGCITDSVAARTLSGDNTATNTMTIESCISFCSAESWVFAGVEFAVRLASLPASLRPPDHPTHRASASAATPRSPARPPPPRPRATRRARATRTSRAASATSSTSSGAASPRPRPPRSSPPSARGSPSAALRASRLLFPSCFAYARVRDGVNGQRSLPNGVATTGPVTIESCTAACFAAGFPIAGAEFAT